VLQYASLIKFGKIKDKSAKHKSGNRECVSLKGIDNLDFPSPKAQIVHEIKLVNKFI